MSLATDLGLGQPMEQVMRSCLVGLRLAELATLEESDRAVVYYVALLAWVGCHADSHEQAAWFGDDIALRAGVHMTELAGLPAAKFVIGQVGRGRPPLRRALLAGALLTRNRDLIARFDMSHCLVAGQLAMRLGLGDRVRDALQDVFERWDGRGVRKLKGDQIALAARIVELADIACSR